MAGSVIARADTSSMGRLVALCFSLGWFLSGFPGEKTVDCLCLHVGVGTTVPQSKVTNEWYVLIGDRTRDQNC